MSASSSSTTPAAAAQAQASTAPASASSSQPCSCAPTVPLTDQWAVQAAQGSTAAAASDDKSAGNERPQVNSQWASLLSSSGNAATAPAAVTSAAASAASADGVAAPAPPPVLAFEWQRHVNYFAMHLRSIPTGYESLDTSRMTMLYFCLSALDVLGAIEATVLSKNLAPGIIDWIYAQQVHPYVDPVTGVENLDSCGFRGGTSMGVPFEPNRTVGHSPSSFPADHAHIAMTYTALCCLRILGDGSFSRLNRRAVIGALRNLQQRDGSFSSTRQRSESDMRFLYCACAISSMLCDWGGFDVERSVKFIALSQSYDGGIGLWPGCEGHGGSTYCAIASLRLMNKMDRLPNLPSLFKWLISNQGLAGYRGRPNKPEDCCYSFWSGASLRMIGEQLGLSKELGGGNKGDSWLAGEANRAFNLRCQHRIGGFRKDPDAGYPDLLHAYFGVCGLSLIGIDEQLQPLDVMLGLTRRVRRQAHAKQERR